MHYVYDSNPTCNKSYNEQHQGEKKVTVVLKTYSELDLFKIYKNSIKKRKRRRNNKKKHQKKKKKGGGGAQHANTH